MITYREIIEHQNAREDRIKHHAIIKEIIEKNSLMRNLGYIFQNGGDAWEYIRIKELYDSDLWNNPEEPMFDFYKEGLKEFLNKRASELRPFYQKRYRLLASEI